MWHSKVELTGGGWVQGGEGALARGVGVGTLARGVKGGAVPRGVDGGLLASKPLKELATTRNRPWSVIDQPDRKDIDRSADEG